MESSLKYEPPLTLPDILKSFHVTPYLNLFFHLDMLVLSSILFIVYYNFHVKYFSHTVFGAVCQIRHYSFNICIPIQSINRQPIFFRKWLSYKIERLLRGKIWIVSHFCNTLCMIISISLETWSYVFC